MGYFLDLMYQLAVSPRQALRAVTRGEKLQAAVVLWLFVLFLLSLTSAVEGPGIGTRLFVAAVVMGLSLFLHSAVTDYCAGFLGGRGTARGITAGFMASSFPYAFSVFAGILQAAAGFGGETLCAALGLWSFALDVVAISENYGFSTGKALFIALIPALLIILFFLCLFAAGLAAALAGLASLDGVSAAWGMMQSL